MRDDQPAVVGVALREIRTVCGQCRAAEQEQEKLFHEFAVNMAGRITVRKRIACGLLPAVFVPESVIQTARIRAFGKVYPAGECEN